ncbi:MAG: GNAT family N-acetyltransferase [Anaerolineae bacterium]
MALMTLQTDRLILRPLQHSDLDDLYEYAQDPLVAEPGMWRVYDSYEAARQHLGELLSAYYDGLMWWAIEHQADGKMIGRCELSHVDRDDKHAEISYALNRDYWHKGIMVEAMAQVIAYAFDTMELNRVHARILTDNERSIRLLTQLGFQREGHLRQHTCVKGHPEDLYIYGLLKSEFTPPSV